MPDDALRREMAQGIMVLFDKRIEMWRAERAVTSGHFKREFIDAYVRELSRMRQNISFIANADSPLEALKSAIEIFQERTIELERQRGPTVT